MLSPKKRKQQLKQADAFQKKAFRLFDSCLAYKRQIVTAAMTLLLMVAATFGWTYFQKNQAQGRREKLLAIDELFAKEAEAVMKQQEGLQEELASIAGKLAGSGDDKSDKPALSDAEKKSLEEQQKEIENKIKAIKPEHAPSAEQYRSYYQSNQKTPEGWRAGLALASILIQEEKYQEAGELAEGILKEAGDHPFYQLQLRNLYIGLLEEQGKFEPALTEAEKLVAKADEDFKPKALLVKGRLELFSGKTELALATFETLINQHSNSAEAQKAKAIKALWK